MPDSVPLSVILVVKDEEHNIGDCLASVRWCEEIVVVDAYSRDRTVEIAREFTDRIYLRPWSGFSEQKTFALNQATHEWVLSLDADERVSAELQEEITMRIHPECKWDGFYIPRKSYFLGKWIRHSGWYPGYQLRLFRKSKTRVSPRRVHEGFLVAGDVGYVTHPIVHFTHSSIAGSLDKMNLYSTLEAEDRSSAGKVRWYDLVFHPAATFLRKYVAQRGFLDGMPGFILALITAQVNLALYMKLWEKQNIPGGSPIKTPDKV